MRVVHDVRDASFPGAALAIGNFDGVHRGHQALFVAARARAPQGLAGALTFVPHPVKVLAPHLAPPLLLTYDERRATIADFGVDFLVEQPFDARFASVTPSAFVDDILVRQLDVAHVVVGPDFSFGKGGQGKTALLRERLVAAGRTLEVLPAVMEGQLVCSSTKIRELLAQGRVDGAALLLGRAYTIAGVVQSGERRGRTIGFPTANLTSLREALPKLGVYVTSTRIEDETTRRASVTNIGLRPTVADGTAGIRIETHVMDFAGDLYDRRIEVAFHTRLRDEMRFSSLEELRAQIARDVASARSALALP